MMWKRLPDSLLVGVFSGFISLSLFYLFFTLIKTAIIDYYQDPYMFQAPKVHLFSILMNDLLFRFIMVKTDKEKLGKGILLATVVVSFVYFYYFLRFHH